MHFQSTVGANVVLRNDLNTVFILICSVQYIKRPGASLDAGCIVAKLVLDDPSHVQVVSHFHFHISMEQYLSANILRVFSWRYKNFSWRYKNY